MNLAVNVMMCTNSDSMVFTIISFFQKIANKGFLIFLRNSLMEFLFEADQCFSETFISIIANNAIGMVLL